MIELIAIKERREAAERHPWKVYNPLYTKRDIDALVAEIERLQNMEAEHKAHQYNSVVEALQVADGGRFRADTIDALLHRLRRLERLQAIEQAARAHLAAWDSGDTSAHETRAALREALKASDR